MAKNIILCSDGTGNKGGYGADTNVFRLFNAVNIHHPDKRQITFYDDGVGTSKNKYLKAIGGAFGFGFNKNVKDLYEFLAWHYKPEENDKIFLFGFSRGAATVRAFAGMVQECGLLDIKNPACQKSGKFDEGEFQKQIKLAMKAYKKSKTDKSFAVEFKKKAVKHPDNAPEGALKIEMIGVWDTVSALGFPQDWFWAFDKVFEIVDKISDLLWPHNFHNIQLDRNVKHVYHALALDDERTTFHPKVWNETHADRPQEIEQVWFSGVHSNVGGGYPRVGMSMVALDWMMARAVKHGIHLNLDAHPDASASANVDGRLYDSRSGAAMFYRYGPRDIVKLCENTQGAVKVHDSVVERIKKGTSRYAPRGLPYDIEIAYTNVATATKLIQTAHSEDDYTKNYREIWRWVVWRKRLYRTFIESTVALLASVVYFWIYLPLPLCADDRSCASSWSSGHVADLMFYFLPKGFDGFTTFFAIMHPNYLLAIIIYFVVLRIFRNYLRGKTRDACERARQSLLKQISRDEEREGDGHAV